MLKNARDTSVQLPALDSQAALVYDSLVQQTQHAVQQAGYQELLLGLSGGLDSALVATVAVDALALMGLPSSNLHAAIMPSQWTSAQSIIDANEIVARLQIQSCILDIMPAYTTISDTLQPVFDPVPAVDFPDKTQENIQARIRAVLLMALSNKFDRLVLATSNFSEISVGYTTLYGDSIGAFAPLAAVYKSWAFELTAFRNQRALEQGNVTPIPSSVLDKEPSAELAPGQTDAAALGSYCQLDALLYALQNGREKPSGFTQFEDLGFDKDYVVEIANRVAKSRYKQQQACPGAMLPDEVLNSVRQQFEQQIQNRKV
ncbi:MAG: NAD(+) synthase [Coriobacteriia bacterium]|nr:NAD(+) synthase [Coriobacteriia bacterium]MCL2605938.1 NAD(+) synthase [Coriobacteriia bacterium]